MKFSVLIPLYNKAPYIRETLGSVLAQTCTDFEIIVIDDGSSDGSADIVEALAVPGLRLVRQANAGVSAARNRGIALARGQWVAFLDGDDLYHPAHLAGLLAAQQACPQADMVGTDYLPVPDRREMWPPAWPDTAGKEVEPRVEVISDLPRRWMRAPSLCTSSVAIRTTRLQEMQPCFAPGESHGEDLDLFFRVGEISPIALTRTPLVAYRVAVRGSLTAHNPVLAMPPFLQRMHARALSGALSGPQRRSSLWLVAQYQVSLARDAIAHGKRRAGLNWLLQGCRAATSKRWWVTAAMALFFPGQLVRGWQHWRLRRITQAADTGGRHDF